MFVLLALVTACAVAEHPACVDTELHACSEVELLHSCNNLLAYDGLRVDFVGAELPVYEATVRLDGDEVRFDCGDGGAAVGGDGLVWSCGPDGFLVSGWGAEVEVLVDDGTTTWASTYAPCWSATEPNGDCCGWNFRADVELELD